MRPVLEVADIFRHHGAAYRADQAGRLSRGQCRVVAAIEACRTPALGGHVERCEDCSEIRIVAATAPHFADRAFPEEYAAERIGRK